MADYTMLGTWSFEKIVSTALPSSVTSTLVYIDDFGNFSTGPSGGGAAFDPNFSYTIGVAAVWTVNGTFNFNAGFSINAPNTVTIVTTGAGSYLNFQSTDDDIYLNAPASGKQIAASADAINFNSAANSVYQSSTGSVTIQANTAGQQVQIFSDGFNFVAANAVNLRSDGDEVTIQASAGGKRVNISGDAFNFNAQVDVGINSATGNMNLSAGSGNIGISSLNTSISGVNGLNIFTNNGGINFNTTNGSLSINAGNGPSTGDLNLGASLGNISISAPGAGANVGINAANGLSLSAGTADANLNTQSGNVNLFSQSGNIYLNVNTNPGQISMNAQGANWSVSQDGIGGGVNAGSGFNILADGSFSFGSGAPAGSFLLGTLTNTVTILAHTGISIVNDTNDISMQASSGNVNIQASSKIKLLIPTLPVANNTPVLMDTDGSIHI